MVRPRRIVSPACGIRECNAAQRQESGRAQRRPRCGNAGRRGPHGRGRLRHGRDDHQSRSRRYRGVADQDPAGDGGCARAHPRRGGARRGQGEVRLVDGHRDRHDGSRNDGSRRGDRVLERGRAGHQQLHSRRARQRDRDVESPELRESEQRGLRQRRDGRALSALRAEQFHRGRVLPGAAQFLHGRARPARARREQLAVPLLHRGGSRRRPSVQREHDARRTVPHRRHQQHLPKEQFEREPLDLRDPKSQLHLSVRDRDVQRQHDRPGPGGRSEVVCELRRDTEFPAQQDLLPRRAGRDGRAQLRVGAGVEDVAVSGREAAERLGRQRQRVQDLRGYVVHGRRDQRRGSARPAPRRRAETTVRRALRVGART